MKGRELEKLYRQYLLADLPGFGCKGSLLFARVVGKGLDTIGLAELSITPAEMAARVKQLARLRGDLERVTALADRG